MHQADQNSQDRVSLNPSDSDNDLNEDSTCQRKDSEDPLNKYSKVDSDAELWGDQDNSYKDPLASVQEDFRSPIDTKLAGVLERTWASLSREFPKMNNWKICWFLILKIALKRAEIYNGA